MYSIDRGILSRPVSHVVGLVQQLYVIAAPGPVSLNIWSSSPAVTQTSSVCGVVSLALICSSVKPSPQWQAVTEAGYHFVSCKKAYSPGVLMLLRRL